MNELTLYGLKKLINEAHAACERALNDGLQHAVEVGRLLIEAKKQAKHGQWLPWVEAHCNFSIRSAQGYMRLSDKLLDGENAQRVAHLSFREALSELATQQLPSPLSEPFHYLVERAPIPRQHKDELRRVRVGNTGIEEWPDDITFEAWRSGAVIMLLLLPEYDHAGKRQRRSSEELEGLLQTA